IDGAAAIERISPSKPEKVFQRYGCSGKRMLRADDHDIAVMGQRRLAEAPAILGVGLRGDHQVEFAAIQRGEKLLTGADDEFDFEPELTPLEQGLYGLRHHAVDETKPRRRADGDLPARQSLNHIDLLTD